MRFVLVTGMSGAGKTTALKMLEDMGYFCIDNLPIPLFPKFAELLSVSDREIENVAVGIDIRGGQALSTLDANLKLLQKTGLQYEILFLDAQDDVLVKRYKETRRNHPLGKGNRIDIGIAKERDAIRFLKVKASYILDTSKMLTRDLRLELGKIFVEGADFKNLSITVMSFGFKYGIPQDADLVFDVRFLPNPYYIEELRAKTGKDPKVRSYVLDNDRGREFVERVTGLLDFLIPNYILEGKNQLVIAVGCTGGRHRSVTLSEVIYEHLKPNDSYGVRIEHRDIRKDPEEKASDR